MSGGWLGFVQAGLRRVFESYNEPCLLAGLFIKLEMGLCLRREAQERKGVAWPGFSCYTQNKKSGGDFYGYQRG